MIPILTKMAVERKCEFEHVTLLGNYELAYALGALSMGFNIEKKEEFESLGALKSEIQEKLSNVITEDVRLSRLLRIVKEMDAYTEEMNEQIYEVYALAFQ